MSRFFRINDAAGLMTIASLTLPLTTAAVAQFATDPAVNYVVGTQPSGITAADFNGDGLADLATTTDGPDKVSTLLNTGGGTYVPGPVAFLGASTSPQDVIAGDWDGDGDMDLAAAVRDPSGAVVILLNDGAGNFAISSTVLVGDRPRGLAAADMDGDDDMDISVANRDGNSVSVLTNTGAGAFSAATMAAGGEPRATAFFDRDGDGDLDLAVTNHDDRSVGIYTNAGGSFSLTTTLFVSGAVRPDGIASADLDGNGTADLAVATSDQVLALNAAAVFLNSGGVFGGPIAYPTGGLNTSDIAIADFDCDADMDIVTANSDSNTISMLANSGAGVFGAPQIMAAGANPDHVTTGDLDGDGDADIATANRDSNSVSVYIDRSCTGSAPGDVNGDGFVNFDDLLAVLSNWGPCPGCAADLDGSGVVGFDDLLQVLSNWS